MTKTNLYTCTMLSLIASGLTAPTAFAASEAALNSGKSQPARQRLDEIIVTAKKRSQSINDVGMSISALSGDSLQKNHVVSLEDISLAVPGLSYANSANNSPIYSLRGVGLQDATLGVYPSVSLYMDETPLPFPILTTNTGFDLERVEVLKGPQGILFGQNSTGGAINFIAKKPTDEFEMGTDLTYGRFNAFMGDAYVSGPLTDTLNARVAIRMQDGDDWQKSSSGNGKAGGADTLAGRLLLDWNPSDNLSVLVNLNAWKDESTPQELQFVAYRPQNPVPSPAENASLADDDNQKVDFSSETNHFKDNSFEQAAVRIDYTFGNELTLTSITSYVDYERREAFDLDGLSLHVLDVTLTQGDVTSFSQELRIANSSNESLRWLFGINYSSDKANEDTALSYPDATLAVATGGVLDRGGSLGNQEMENYAAFASLEMDIADNLTIKGGLRYTEADREIEACTYDIDGRISAFYLGGFGVSVPLGGCSTLNENFEPVLHEDELNEDNVSWQLGVDWKPNSDSLYYINIAKGYKAGSFPVLAAGSTSQFVAATEESLIDYEAGAKLELWDNKLAANFAIFYYDYSDKQLRTSADVFPFGLLDVLGNIPESSVKGFETDLTAYLIDGLIVKAEFTYLDAKIDKFVGRNGNGVVEDFSNTNMPLTPNRQASISGDYTFEFGENLNANLALSVIYRSETNATLGNDSAFEIPDYTLVNASASIGSIDEKWRVQIWGKNIFDKYYRNNVFAFQDAVTASAGQTATYGVTLSLRY